jgi:glycosyltransferase involved in cell wall biosynthesis
VIRVLHLVTWLEPGGIESWVLNLVGAIDRDRYALDICCKGSTVGSWAPKAEAKGAGVYHCPYTLPGWSFRRRFARLLAEKQYDIVHIHTGMFSGLPTRIAKAQGRGVVLTFHSVGFAPSAGGAIRRLGWLRQAYAQRSIRSAFAQADRVLTCSEEVLRSLREQFEIEPEANQGVWYCGVPPMPTVGPDERASLRKDIAAPPSAPIVMHVGSFREAKNHAGLVRVAARVQRAMPEALFVLVGDGPLRPTIEQQVQAAGLGHAFRFLGRRTDVARLLAIGDVFLFPSRWEGLPVSVVEAQMQGLVVVGSDIPTIGEAVDQGHSALLHDIEDEAGMAESVVMLLRNPERRASMAVCGRDFADRRFTEKASVEAICDVYNQVAIRRS